MKACLAHVMGIDEDFDTACYKALFAAGNRLPTEGGVYITVNDNDKPAILGPAKELKDMGFTIYSCRFIRPLIPRARATRSVIPTISSMVSGFSVNGGRTMVASPEWHPAYSTCSMMPPM